MPLFLKDELKFLWLFYLEKLFSKLLFILPGFMIIYFNGLNLSMFQIGILIAAWPFATLIFEIPTGAFADTYGRKNSVLLGLFLQFIIILIFYFSNNYFVLLSLMTLVGISSTLVTGADEAWAVDLINDKNNKLLRGYFAKSISLTSLGLVVSGLLGAYFVKFFGINIIWIITSLSFLASFIILFFAEENIKKIKLVKEKHSGKLLSKIKASINYSIQNKYLFDFFIAGAFISFASSFFTLITWTAFMKNLGYPDYAFGYMVSLISLTGIFAPLLSEKLCKKTNEKQIITLSLTGLIILISVILFVKNIFTAFIILLGGTFLLYIVSTLSKAYFHKFIPNSLRATISSINAMILSFVGTLAFPLAGFSVDLIGARYTLLISGILFVPSLIIYYSSIHSKRH